MKNNFIKALKFIIPIFFWLGLWQVLALLVNHPYLLPTLPETLSALWDIIISKEFFKVTILSILRVVSGLVLGTFSGIILATLSYYFQPVRLLITPLISIMKSTPIATIIILLWIMLSGDALVIFISVLMVMPIIWQNLMDGYNSINRELIEVCDIFEISLYKRMKILIIPALIRYFIPAFITSTGLAWKAVISAEIIAYAKNSIGQFINDAKYNFDSPSVFAWTLVVIILSIALERLTKYLLRRYNQ